MSYYNQQQQPPVGVPPPQGYPVEGYPKDAYPPPSQAPQYAQPHSQYQQNNCSEMHGMLFGCIVLLLFA